VQQSHAVRDRASDPTTSSIRRPVVEPVVPKPIGLDARHEIRPSAYATPTGRKPSSPLPSLVCNWAAALFALGAAFVARRQRSRARTTASAQVLRLPPPEAGLRPVSRAA